MPIEFKLPELGENIMSGDVVNVLVNEGEEIVGNQGVIELETEKAVVEVPCPHAGKVVKLHVKKGQTVKVGQTILSVEAETQPQEASEQPPEEKEGEAATTTPQPKATGGKRETAEAKATPPSTAAVAAGPEARRLARELGLDLSQLAGSGKGGRITPDDVRAAAEGTANRTAPAPQTATATKIEAAVEPPGEPGDDAYGPVRRERISRIRGTIAAQMAKSARTIPHVTNFDDADVTDLESVRKSVPPEFVQSIAASLPRDASQSPLKLTMLPFVMRGVALALRQHSLLNASLDEENEEIVYKRYVNLGLAVDTPRGLVVPVLRNADQLGILQIAEQSAAMTARARAAKFTLEEVRGGTFTISNLGAIGGTYSTPIINHPEVAILLLGRSRWLPVVRQGNIVQRFMMPLSLSYDHRVVDGAAAGRFLNEVIGYLESPGKLLLST